MARPGDAALGRRLDEAAKGVEEYPVARRAGSAVLGLQPGPECGEVGSIAADGSPCRVGRVGEGADVRDAQFPELLLAKIRVEPVVVVCHVVVADDAGHLFVLLLSSAP